MNPFVNNPAFSVGALSLAMQRLPYNIYGRVTELGLFGAKGVTTTSVIIEENGGVLNLIPASPRGGPGNVNQRGKRKARAFAIPHIEVNDQVIAEEVQGMRAFGSDSAAQSVNAKVNDILQQIKNKHDITKEWMRVGALKGILLDADGTTVLYNWFTEFGITPVTQTFTFSSPTFDVKGAIINVKRQMEDHLLGDTMRGAYALVSPEFFDALTSHATVIDAFKYFASNQRPGGDYRQGFEYAGVTFEEYRGTATDPTGTAHKFIAASTAQFFPLGTNSTFREFNAPADFNETVNTMGQPYYAKMEPVKFDRGTEIHTQSNPLMICTRPELLVQGTMA